MLRILHVVTDMRRGGLETMLMNYYRHMDRSKIQFDFLTHREYMGDYGEEILQLGGKVYHISPLNPFSNYYKKELEKFFMNHPEYVIIHVHQDCMSSVILKEAQKCGVKVRIAHSHSSNQDKNFKYPIKIFYKRFIPRYATNLLACGKEAGEWMFNGANFQVLNNAINAKQYQFDKEKRVQMRRSLGVSDDEFVIGHVGRFSPVKNHLFLLKVYKEILKEKKAKLLMVGDGQLRMEIEQEIEKLGIASNVILTGVRKDVCDLMQAMDVFVLPSLYEGLVIVGVEAQAAGLPCVFSESIPEEVILTNDVKRIALTASMDEWAKQILEMRNKKRTDTHGVICRAGYDINSNVKKLEEYYLNLLK